jgi:Family of unknown function (DUF5990)
MEHPLPKTPTLELKLELRCSVLPSAHYQGQPTIFGVQDTQGNLLLGTPAGDTSRLFRLVIAMHLPTETAAADFTGLYVHGKKGERFLYLGYRQVDQSAWIRRWKIMLAEIPASQLIAATSQAGMMLSANFLPDQKVRLDPEQHMWLLQPSD